MICSTCHGRKVARAIARFALGVSIAIVESASVIGVIAYRFLTPRWRL